MSDRSTQNLVTQFVSQHSAYEQATYDETTVS